MSTGLSDPNVSPRGIEYFTTYFNNLLVTAAKSCMEFVLRKKPPKKKEKGKRWCNSECTNMKKRLQDLSRLLMKNPNDPFIRGQYCKVKKDYGKTMKFHRINFEKNAVDGQK